MPSTYQLSLKETDIICTTQMEQILSQSLKKVVEDIITMVTVT